MSNFIFSCPLEILVEILLHLDAESLWNCKLTCRTFLDAIRSSLNLEIRFKCDSWGYCGPSADTSVLTAPEYLTRLERHIAAWQSLDWEEHEIKLPEPGGAFIVAQGIFATVPGGRENSDVYIYQLPSRLKKTQPHQYVIKDVGFWVKDIAIDPSQNLLLLLEMQGIDGDNLCIARLHVLRLSEGPSAVHPNARLQVLDTLHSVDIENTSQLAVWGSRIAFMWREEDSLRDGVIQVWDWKRGEMLWSKSNTTNIEVWEVSDQLSDGKKIRRFLVSEPSGYDGPSTLKILGDLTPPTGDRAQFLPSTGGQRIKLTWDIDTGLPGIPSPPDDAEHPDEPGIDPQIRYEIFVRRDTFLSDFEHSTHEPIPYFVWAAGNVAVLQDSTPGVLNFLESDNCAGRYARTREPSGDSIVIHDFNMPRYARDARPNHPSEPTIVRPSRDPPGNALAGDDIRSYSSPYWTVERDISFEQFWEFRDTVMLDEERIIFMKVSLTILPN
ncbi:hypothetical protein DL93DRAFT_1551924 [Clavulina sp. PMI_390]|nr:hypothetical protein DL93DRAFT_1551924 [Clavulina sp. PMI_390]